MILGVGVDIVRVERFFHWVQNKGLARRFFEGEELQYIYSRGAGASLSFASHFAAKEAYGKALGCGISFGLREVSVLPKKGGAPILKLSGRARALFEERGGSAIHLSLSHEAEYAVAFVVLEKA